MSELSLFIAGLAFRDIPSLVSAKIGIFAGSLIAAGTGWAFLYTRARRPDAPSHGPATVIPFPGPRVTPPPPAL